MIIYIRVSLERERMYSPKTQLKGCQRYAVKHDLEIIGEPVEDLDKTGRDFAARKIAELILRIHNGEADAILIYRINRWGRNAEACMDYLKQLVTVGGNLVSTKEVIDLTTSAGRKAIRDAFSDAEYESDVIGDNWRAAHEDRWDVGLPHHGRGVFGYRRCPSCRRRKDNERAFEFCEECEGVQVRDDRTTAYPIDHTNYDPWTAQPRSAALVEFITRLIAGEQVRGIVTDLASRGVRSLNGKPLDSQALYRAADTGFWAGLIRRKSEKRREETGNSHRPEDYDVWLKGAHEPLVPKDKAPELWAKYRTVRAKKRRNHSEPLAVHLGTGFLRCFEIRESGEVCKSSMTSFQMHYRRRGKKGKGEVVKSQGNRCSTFATVGSSVCRGVSIKAEHAEAEILRWIEANAKGGDFMEEKIKAATAKYKVNQDKIAELEKKLERQQGRKRELIDSYADSEMSQEDYAATLKRFNSSIRDMQSKLEKAQKSALLAGPMPSEHFRGLRKEWPRLSVARKRQALSRIISRIEVRRRPTDDKAGRGHGHNLMTIVSVWDAA
ncbi:recombinase family protein [Streptomyces sp. NPDC056500]|uniref:recombinase family protein n=1 Tax=Streptomyces sp. NPDC056500 TaxID=3345840 RepID=UPI00367B1C02